MPTATNAIPKKRTTRYTDAEILKALKVTNGMIYLAAKSLGCEPSTIYRRMEKSKAVRDVVEDSRGELLDMAETSLKSAVLNKEGWAVCFALKTLGKGRGYIERTEHEVTLSWRDKLKDAGVNPDQLFTDLVHAAQKHLQTKPE